MTYSEIDWLVTWKLFHWEFCWIYVAVSVPIRFILARGFNRSLLRRKALYVAASSVTSSLVSTWFPVLPVIAGVLLTLIAGRSSGELLVFSAPVVAVSLAVETSLLDLFLIRLLLKRTVNRHFATVFVANVVNAAIALTLGLMWAIHHMPTFEAVLNR